MIGQGSGHAVVIGRSTAGLTAALVLAKHAERVTIIERDRYPEQPEPRKGVPQSKHTHVLLDGGLAALRRLLPVLAHPRITAVQGTDVVGLAGSATRVTVPTPAATEPE